LLIAISGDDASSTKASIDAHEVEIVGFDKASGVYNFYSLEDLDGKGRSWRHFGSSHDLVAKGPGEGTSPNQVRRCASCHVNGGLVNTGIHWNIDVGDFRKVAREHVAKSPDALGQALTGVAFVDNALTPGNRQYASATVDHRKNKLGFKKLL